MSVETRFWSSGSGFDGKAEDGLTHEVPSPIGMEADHDEEEHPNLNVMLKGNQMTVQDALQLPSPSPSPRSSSPSLVITEASSAEWNGHALPIPEDYMYSGSFEKPAGFGSNAQEGDEGLSSPLPISKALPPHELHDIPEEREGARKPRKTSISKIMHDEKVLKLSPAEMQELTSAPESLPITSPRRPAISSPTSSASPSFGRKSSSPDVSRLDLQDKSPPEQIRKNSDSEILNASQDAVEARRPSIENCKSI